MSFFGFGKKTKTEGGKKKSTTPPDYYNSVYGPYLYNQKRHLKRKSRYINKQDHAIRQHRIKVYKETDKAARKRVYTNKKGKKVKLIKERPVSQYRLAPSKRWYKEMEDGTKVIDNIPRFDDSQISVINMDSYNATILVQEENKKHKVAVLNMANQRYPGGGTKTGAMAQEEELCRRSDLLDELEISDYEDGMYPMSEIGAIYSSNIAIYRDTANNNYEWLDKPVYTNVLSVAAIRYPRLIHNKYLCDEDAEVTMQKIRSCFDLAIMNGVTCLVLSALGCGAFRNPPYHIAHLFRSVLNEDVYKNAFYRVVFAILEDKNSKRNKNGNIKPFQEILVDNQPFEMDSESSYSSSEHESAQSENASDGEAESIKSDVANDSSSNSSSSASN